MAGSKSLAPKIGRPRKYTAEQLQKVVEKYFRSIGWTRKVTELVPTGEVDGYGHPKMREAPVYGDTDSLEPLREWCWVKPPTVGGLCRALGVHRSTWSLWANDAELCEVVEWARDVMQGYLEEELLTREGKNTRGVEFALSANYGVNEKHTVQLERKPLDFASMTDEELQQIAADLKNEWEDFDDV